MSAGDRITIFVAAGAVSAALGVGSCSTNTRFDDVRTLVNSRIDDVHRRFDDVSIRFDDVNARIDDLQADVRELRALIVATGREEPAD